VLNLSGNELGHFCVYQINEDLKVLNLSRNNLTTFSLKAFKTNEKSQLEHLDLSFNKLERLDFDDVFGFKKNATLLLNHNRIANFVYPDVRCEIQKLNLESNILSKIAIRSDHFRVLDLCNNLNVKLDAGFFDKLSGSNLTELHLSNTNLKLFKDTFKNLEKLTVLNISNNRYINCLSGEYLHGLKDLKYLYANGCLISGIEADAFTETKNLVYLDLSWNELVRVGAETFEGCDSLVAIDLSNNTTELVIEKSCFDKLNNFLELIISNDVKFENNVSRQFFVKFL
jgi:Leucine-rich repeat (LRR) protein